jgi:hypothetical protein
MATAPTTSTSTTATLPRVIASLHLLPSEHSRRRVTYTPNQIVDHALLHTQIAHENGVRALYIQDVHDTPVAPKILPHTIANVTAVGKAIRQAFSDIHLGVCLMQHGAREPLQIADAIGADFVRIKVWLGAMMKAEGLITGCAYEGIQYRAEIGARHIKIFTDIYDRVGVPVNPLPLAEACRQAVVFCQSDGLVLTGMNVDDSESMFRQIAPLRLGVPLILGGGATSSTVPRFPQAEHFIVHGAFIRRGLPAKNGLPVEWGAAEVGEFMTVVRNLNR